MKTLKDFMREILDLVPGSAVFQVWTFAFQTKIHPFYQIGGRKGREIRWLSRWEEFVDKMIFISSP